VARELLELNRDLGADEAALSTIDALGKGALAIVTGQQVGILGGPLYTLYKALSAVRVARNASALLERPVVPLFWMDTDDQDFEREACPPLGLRELVPFTTRPRRRSRIPVGGRRLGPLSRSPGRRVLAPRPEFGGALQLSRYTPGRTSPASGLPLSHARNRPRDRRPHSRAETAGRPLSPEPEGQESEREFGRRPELVAAGYHAQASPADSQLNLSYARPERHPIGVDGPALRLAPEGEALSIEEVERLLTEEPEAFSPNVLLRPVYQDTLLPTLAYIAGPSELAYFAQSCLYDHFGSPCPWSPSRESRRALRRVFWSATEST
jgi:hypothetical protein